MKVRLIRKLAPRLDGIDVSAFTEGDVLELSPADARVLVAEGWAVACRGPESSHVRRSSHAPPRSVAADRRGARRSADELRRVREDMERRHGAQQQRQRAEDRIREELHDEQARTVGRDGQADA